LIKVCSLLLQSPVEQLKGIGLKKAEALKSIGIFRIFDLLRLAPAKYQDRTRVFQVKDAIADGSLQGFFVLILEKIKCIHARRSLAIITAEFSDETGKIQAKWFNKTYLIKQLKTGQSYWLYGQVQILAGKLTLNNPEIESCKVTSEQNNCLTPVYSSNSSLSQARISPLALRKLIANALDEIDLGISFPGFNEKTPFKPISDAIINIHRPENLQAAKKAEYTLAFFDQVLFQIGVLKRRQFLTGTLSLPNSNKSKPFKTNFSLPFQLTSAQKQSLGDIMQDLQPQAEKPPMNRLLQGDVGCGKTLVAFLAMLEFSEKLENDSQSVFMAPTEILAVQHFDNFKKYFPSQSKYSVILTGSQLKPEREQALKQIASGQAKYIFGTHALFQQKIIFSQLRLCIIDEQQRFGVNHRRLLINKGHSPHQLLLSATPIPRTLSLTIFGDMDTSIIDEMPPDRSPVFTSVANNLNETIYKVKNTISSGNKIYLVCPVIEASEKTGWTSVNEALQIMKQLVPEAKIEILTGQIKSDEKKRITKLFKRGAVDILIATTVIEVGVDHPDATLMIIVNADRFGLSQLHQLRGRVGRSEKKACCILVSDNSESNDRLSLLCSTNDGFALSFEDLKLRGPGDLVGTRQSGLSHPCFSHRIPAKMVEKARVRAFEILTKETKPVRDWFVAEMINSFKDNYKTFMEGG
jgi:ATP-dependent DNA helicase RecG